MEFTEIRGCFLMKCHQNRKDVANLLLDDIDLETLIENLANRDAKRKIAIGIHITTLNATFRKLITKADFSDIDYIYPDGWSVQLLARMSGLSNVQRIATTELVPLLLQKFKEPLRVCFVGGPTDIGPAISERWSQFRSQDKSFFFSGYQPDWHKTLKDIRSTQSDILLLGLGMPNELLFIKTYSEFLPDNLIITCGGLLRILAGVEKRSPKIIQLLRMEWLYRLVTSPRRTTSRYTIGIVNLLRALLIVLRNRL